MVYTTDQKLWKQNLLHSEIKKKVLFERLWRVEQKPNYFCNNIKYTKHLYRFNLLCFLMIISNRWNIDTYTIRIFLGASSNKLWNVVNSVLMLCLGCAWRFSVDRWCSLILSVPSSSHPWSPHTHITPSWHHSDVFHSFVHRNAVLWMRIYSHGWLKTTTNKHMCIIFLLKFTY